MPGVSLSPDALASEKVKPTKLGEEKLRAALHEKLQKLAKQHQQLLTEVKNYQPHQPKRTAQELDDLKKASDECDKEIEQKTNALNSILTELNQKKTQLVEVESKQDDVKSAKLKNDIEYLKRKSADLTNEILTYRALMSWDASPFFFLVRGSILELLKQKTRLEEECSLDADSYALPQHPTDEQNKQKEEYCIKLQRRLDSEVNRLLNPYVTIYSQYREYLASNGLENNVESQCQFVAVTLLKKFEDQKNDLIVRAKNEIRTLPTHERLYLPNYVRENELSKSFGWLFNSVYDSSAGRYPLLVLLQKLLRQYCEEKPVLSNANKLLERWKQLVEIGKLMNLCAQDDSWFHNSQYVVLAGSVQWRKLTKAVKKEIELLGKLLLSRSCAAEISIPPLQKIDFYKFQSLLEELRDLMNWHVVWSGKQIIIVEAFRNYARAVQLMEVCQANENWYGFGLPFLNIDTVKWKQWLTEFREAKAFFSEKIPAGSDRVKQEKIATKKTTNVYVEQPELPKTQMSFDIRLERAWQKHSGKFYVAGLASTAACVVFPPLGIAMKLVFGAAAVIGLLTFGVCNLVEKFYCWVKTFSTKRKLQNFRNKLQLPEESIEDNSTTKITNDLRGESKVSNAPELQVSAGHTNILKSDSDGKLTAETKRTAGEELDLDGYRKQLATVDLYGSDDQEETVASVSGTSGQIKSATAVLPAEPGALARELQRVRAGQPLAEFKQTAKRTEKTKSDLFQEIPEDYRDSAAINIRTLPRVTYGGEYTQDEIAELDAKRLKHESPKNNEVNSEETEDDDDVVHGLGPRHGSQHHAGDMDEAPMRESESESKDDESDEDEADVVHGLGPRRGPKAEVDDMEEDGFNSNIKSSVITILNRFNHPVLPTPRMKQPMNDRKNDDKSLDGHLSHEELVFNFAEDEKQSSQSELPAKQASTQSAASKSPLPLQDDFHNAKKSKENSNFKSSDERDRAIFGENTIDLDSFFDEQADDLESGLEGIRVEPVTPPMSPKI